jgi:hypothetical protein
MVFVPGMVKIRTLLGAKLYWDSIIRAGGCLKATVADSLQLGKGITQATVYTNPSVTLIHYPTTPSKHHGIERKCSSIFHLP